MKKTRKIAILKASNMSKSEGHALTILCGEGCAVCPVNKYIRGGCFDCRNLTNVIKRF